MKQLFILFLLFIAHCPLSIGYCQWPTTVEGSLFVDYGVVPFLAIDKNDQSVIVVYNNTTQIRAKKYDKYGYPMWGGNYVVLIDTFVQCYAYPSLIQVISDDSGGAVAVWYDFRHSTFNVECEPTSVEMYWQRVDCNGQTKFGANGAQLPIGGWFGDMKMDYHDGIIMANPIHQNEVSVRRYNRSGSEVWSRSYNASYIDLNATDEQGNIFISYGNTRQKLDLNGNELWPDTLLGRIPDSRGINSGGALSDGHGGVIGVTWRYENSAYIIYVNRVDSSGQYVFGNGVDVGYESGMYYAPDQEGGIFVDWTTTPGYNSHLQRVSNVGQIVWNPELITCTGSCAGSRGLAENIFSEVYVVWDDTRNSPAKSFYAQRIDSTGRLLWDSIGIELHRTNDDPLFEGPARSLYPDMRNGFIMVWNELGAGLRVLLKQMSINGIIGDTNSTFINEGKGTLKRFELHQNYPNPFNNSTAIMYEIPTKEKIVLTLYNVLGQKVKTIDSGIKEAGSYRIELRMGGLASGLYIYRLEAGQYKQSKKLLYLK